MRRHRLGMLFVCVAIASGWLALRACFADEMAGVPEIRPGVLAGYLAKEAIPDSLALLPPPPEVGSAAAALDGEIARADLALRGTPRWVGGASSDASSSPDAASSSPPPRVEAKPIDELTRARDRIAELERVIGRQQADLHFFREALRLWDAKSPASGAPISTKSSKK